MNHSLRKAVVVGSVVLLAGTAMAGDIYKYVDENGEVHYGDRPTGEPAEQRMGLVSRSTDSASVNERIDQRLERDAAREEARKLREKDAEERAMAREDAKEKAAKCEENRARLSSYGEALRLYKQDDSGERVYLDDAERAAAEDRVRDNIAKYCG
mgnify:CR=1 FL=1